MSIQKIMQELNFDRILHISSFPTVKKGLLKIGKLYKGSIST